ncbi:hypothetical protein [Sphingomonas sp. 2SG]|uniref:hypothetical protein n=1 Tax=Sphingomonas sp. 2SG TaxID=2502201 RepID=UPI0010FA1111|nr:hypothetical protein [Sphingomonas sp. 2SG]
MLMKPETGFASIVSLLLSTCMPNPVQVVPIPTGIPEVHVTLELRVEGLDDGRYVLTVVAPKGRKSFDLWRDWGPAQRASFYLTGNDSLYVYGMGGDLLISLEKKEASGLFSTNRNIGKFNRLTLIYIGSVDRKKDTDALHFFSPDQQTECAIYTDLATPFLAAIYERNIPACSHSPKGWRA